MHIMVAGHQLQTATPAHLPHGMGQVTEAGGRLPTDVRCDGRRRTPTYPLAHSTARPWWWALPTWGHEGPASGPQLEVMRVAGSCRCYGGCLHTHERRIAARMLPKQQLACIGGDQDYAFARIALRGCYPNNRSRALGATRTTPSLTLPDFFLDMPNPLPRRQSPASHSTHYRHP